MRLSLRVNEAQDLDVWYEQAVDYPLDLYYLMDLSKSMEDDKEKISTLVREVEGEPAEKA